ncbi:MULTISPECIES: hypothetical protein [unclassified Microcoleus]|uniref:hypothetical protein n=1 Tax=unclassified Microcoleus TaxID=2642155 RepID=UPI002FD38541
MATAPTVPPCHLAARPCHRSNRSDRATATASTVRLLRLCSRACGAILPAVPVQPNQSPQNLLDRARWCILPACQCQPCECECQRVDRPVASESSDRPVESGNLKG